MNDVLFQLRQKKLIEIFGDYNSSVNNFLSSGSNAPLTPNRAQPVRALDTLAQLRKPAKTGACSPVNYACLTSDKAIITGKEKPPPNPEIMLKKKAGAKWFHNKLIFLLAAQESAFKSRYIKSSFCCKTLIQDGQTLAAKYCNQRWCAICNRIRTAKAINGYMPVMNVMSDLHFVTLTVPNVPGEEIRATCKEMLKEFNKAKDVWRKHNTKILSGIRKLEVTYNKQRNDFHPHFHVIIQGEEEGKFLIKQWLQRFPTAEKWCQHSTPCIEGTLKELFKYATKLVNKFYDPDKKRSVTSIEPGALDMIFRQLHKMRIFQPFGEVKKIAKNVSEDVEDIDRQAYGHLPYEIEKEWNYEPAANSWIDINTGELLVDYIAPLNINKMFEALETSKPPP